MRSGKPRGKLVLLLLAALMLLTGTASASNPADPAHPDYQLYKNVENSLMCTDGCGMSLAACDNATARQMREEISEFINQGMAKDEILQSFVDIYGIEVLTYPPKRGFNVSAWLTPFIAILAGGLGIYLALDRWVFAHEVSQPAPAGQEADRQLELAEYERLIEKERQKYF